MHIAWYRSILRLKKIKAKSIRSQLTDYVIANLCSFMEHSNVFIKNCKKYAVFGNVLLKLRLYHKESFLLTYILLKFKLLHMRIVFGWNHFVVRTFNPKELGLTNEKTIRIRNKYICTK